MNAPLSGLEVARGSSMHMARWRRWLFDRLARWEEASLARSLGLPAERVTFIDVDQAASRRSESRAPDARRASNTR